MDLPAARVIASMLQVWMIGLRVSMVDCEDILGLIWRVGCEKTGCLYFKVPRYVGDENCIIAEIVVLRELYCCENRERAFCPSYLRSFMLSTCELSRVFAHAANALV